MQSDPRAAEAESFVAHIRANPDDELPRLIYADYLEERGDPRGELIRLQCELMHLPAGDANRSGLIDRERELLAAHSEGWLAPLRELGATGVSARCFQRGLIERVRLEATAFANNIGRLCALAPALTWVELRGVESATTAVAETELPAQIRGLDLSANRLGPPALAQLKDARWNAQLEELNVAFNELADEGTRELASVAWPKLRVLALGRNRIGPEGIRALAASALPALRSLSLALNPVGPVGAQLLARSPLLANLEELDLASARIQAEGATALARANALRALRRLNLRANQLKGPAWQDLAQARQWDLTELDLRLNSMTGDEAEMLRRRYGDVLLV